MRNRGSWIVSVFLVLHAIPSSAQVAARPVLAVFDIENRDAPLNARLLDGLTGFLVARLAGHGVYAIVPREQVKARLVDQKRESYQSCYAESCQIELGKELAAQKSLATVVLRIGKTCEVTATMYDLARATTERAATSGGPCSEEGVKAALEAVASELSAQPDGEMVRGPALKGLRDNVALGFARTAEALLAEGKVDESIALLQKAYARERAPAILLLLAQCFEKRGILVEARKAYEGYLATEPDPTARDAAQVNLAALLDRMPGRLSLTVAPPEAVLDLDGARLAALPRDGIDLRRGTHRIRLMHEGYAPHDQEIVIEPGSELPLQIRLAPLPGQLSVDCPCPGARLSIDGAEVSELPLHSPVELAAGRHAVEILAGGFERYTTIVEIRPGTSEDLSVSLVALPARASEPLPTRVPVETVAAPSRGPKISPWQWVMVGTGAAIVAAGGAFSGLAARDRAEITDSTRSGNVVTGLTLPEAQALASRAKTRDRAAYALYAVGGAVAMTGIVLAIIDTTRGRAVSGPTVSAAPVPEGVVLHTTGRF